MSDSERSPLLSVVARSSRQTSDTSVETSPLLSSSDATPRYDGQDGTRSDVSSVRSIGSNASSNRSPTKRSRRWPSIIAMAMLGLVSIAIIVIAFFVPTAVEEYAKEATVLEPTNLSLESITADGVRARVQANFRLDGSRVRNEHVRRIGRIATWLVRELGTEGTRVSVYLPEYDNTLLGTATVPPLVFNIMDGHNTQVDFIADLTPGDGEGFRMIANEWLEGRVDLLRVQGKADVQLKSGIIPLGTHPVSESLVLEAKNLPQVPQFNITKLNFEEERIPGTDTMGMGADLSISLFNKYPVQIDIPELGFDILVPNCAMSDPYIMVADTVTRPIAVRPQSDLRVDVHGLIRELPKSLTSACPNSDSSPLDLLLKQYMSGEDATVFVRGKKDSSGTPDWIGEIISSVTVPVPFPGRTFGNLIRDFSLTDVHFSLPDPLAEPGDPDASPKISGTIVVTAALPSEMNFNINVTEVRASADVFYQGDKLGELNIEEWQLANSTRAEGSKHQEATLKIQSRIKDAPLDVTDGDVFSVVVQTLLFGGKKVTLDVKSLVDVRIMTVLGVLVLKDVPAEGKVPVKPLPRGVIGGICPQIDSLRILDSTYTSLTVEARVNITNRTPYTADIPAIRVHVLSNGSIIGEATARNLKIEAGNNSNLVIGATWNPGMGGDAGAQVGRDLLSQYLSGYNVSVTLKTHRDTFPSQPLIGDALSRLNITLAAPRLRLPGENEEDPGHFIRSAIFHVFTSTAAFTLVSPLERNTLYLEHINATAFYNHTEPIGQIVHDLPFAAPPGTSQTPRLPVTWSLDSVGFEKLRQAIGGVLKLDAKAEVGVRLGNWKETVWYVGHGIGAHVRP